MNDDDLDPRCLVSAVEELLDEYCGALEAVDETAAGTPLDPSIEYHIAGPWNPGTSPHLWLNVPLPAFEFELNRTWDFDPTDPDQQLGLLRGIHSLYGGAVTASFQVSLKAPIASAAFYEEVPPEDCRNSTVDLSGLEQGIAELRAAGWSVDTDEDDDYFYEGYGLTLTHTFNVALCGSGLTPEWLKVFDIRLNFDLPNDFIAHVAARTASRDEELTDIFNEIDKMPELRQAPPPFPQTPVMPDGLTLAESGYRSFWVHEALRYWPELQPLDHWPDLEPSVWSQIHYDINNGASDSEVTISMAILNLDVLRNASAPERQVLVRDWLKTAWEQQLSESDRDLPPNQRT